MDFEFEGNKYQTLSASELYVLQTPQKKYVVVKVTDGHATEVDTEITPELNAQPAILQ